MKKLLTMLCAIFMVSFVGLALCGCKDKYDGASLKFGGAEHDVVLMLGSEDGENRKSFWVDFVGSGDVDGGVEIDVSDSNIATIENLSKTNNRTSFELVAQSTGKASVIARLSEKSDIMATFNFEVKALSTSVVCDALNPVVECGKLVLLSDLNLAKVYPSNVSDDVLEYFLIDKEGEITNESLQSLKIENDKIYITDNTELDLGNYITNQKITIRAALKTDASKFVDVEVRVVRELEISSTFYVSDSQNSQTVIESGYENEHTFQLNNENELYNCVYAEVKIKSFEKDISKIEFKTFKDIILDENNNIESWQEFDHNSLLGVQLIRCNSTENDGKYEHTFVYKIKVKQVASDPQVFLPQCVVVDNSFRVITQQSNMLWFKSENKPSKIMVNDNELATSQDGPAQDAPVVVQTFANDNADYHGVLIGFKTYPQDSANSYLGNGKLYFNPQELSFFDLSGEKINSEASQSNNDWHVANINTSQRYYVKGIGTKSLTSLCYVQNSDTEKSYSVGGWFAVEVAIGVQSHEDITKNWSLASDGGPGVCSVEIQAQDTQTIGKVAFVKSSTAIIATQDEADPRILHLTATQTCSDVRITVVLGGGVTFDILCNVICEVDQSSILPIVVPGDAALKIDVDHSNKEINITSEKCDANEGTSVLLNYYPLSADIECEIVVDEDDVGTLFVDSDGKLYSTKLGQHKATLKAKYKKVVDDSETGIENKEFDSYTITFNVVQLSTSFALNKSSEVINDFNSVGALQESKTKHVVSLFAAEAGSVGCDLIESGKWQGNILKVGNNNDCYIECIWDEKNSIFDFDVNSLTVTAKQMPPEGRSTITFVLHQYGKTMSASVTITLKRAEKVQKIYVDNISSDLVYGYYERSQNSKSVRISAITDYKTSLNISVWPESAENKEITYRPMFTDPSQSAYWTILYENGQMHVGLSDTGRNNLAEEIKDVWIELAPQDSYIESGNPQRNKCAYVRISVETGSENNPYKIYSAAEFVAYMTAQTQNLHYELCSTIDVTNYCNMLPLPAFKGTLKAHDDADVAIRGINLTNENVVKTDAKHICGLFKSVENEICGIRFEGGINISSYSTGTLQYFDNVFVGLVAPTNNGKILNCKVVLDDIKIEINSGFVGGVVAQNNNEIAKCIVRQSSTNTKFVAKKMSSQKLFVGGVCAQNSGSIHGNQNNTNDEDKIDLDEIRKRFSKASFTVILNIDAQNATALGMICAENNYNAKIQNVSADGNLSGGLCVGGLVGTNNYEISNSHSTVYVQGHSSSGEIANIGGIVGFQSNGGGTETTNIQINQCVVLAINDRQTPADSILKVKASGQGTNQVGLILGELEYGKFDNCYFVSYVQTQSKPISPYPDLSSGEPSSYIKLFCHALGTKEANTHTAYYWVDWRVNWDEQNPVVNFKIQAQKDENGEGYNYSKSSWNISAPSLPLQENVKVNDGYKFDGDQADIVLALDSTKTATGTLMSDYFAEINGFNIKPLNADIATIDTQQQLVVGSEGLASFALSSYFNTNINLVVYLYLYTQIDEMDFSININGEDFDIDNKTLTIFKDDNVVLTTTPSLVGYKNYLIALNENPPGFSLQNLDGKVILSANETGECEIEFVRMISCTINGQTYTKIFGDDVYATSTVVVKNGTRDVKISYQEIEVSSGSNVEIAASIKTDVANDVVKFEGIAGVAHNLKAVTDYKYYAATISFTAPTYQTNGQNEHTLKIFGANNLLLATLKVVVTPPQTESVVATYYSTKQEFKDSNESMQIYTGSLNGFGVLKLQIGPSGIDENTTYEIFNHPNNASKLDFAIYKFENDQLTVETSSKMGESIDFALGDRTDQVIYIRVALEDENYLPNNTPITICVRATDTDEVFSYTYFTKNTKEIKIGLEKRGDVGGQIENVAANCLYEIAWVAQSYSIDYSIAASSNNSRTFTFGDNKKDYLKFEITKGNAKFIQQESRLFVHILGPAGETVTIKASCFKDGKSSSAYIQQDELTLKIQQFVVLDILLEGGVNDGEFIYVNTPYQSDFEAMIDLVHDINIEFDATNLNTAAKVAQLENTLSTMLELGTYNFAKFEEYYDEIETSDYLTIRTTKVFNGFEDERWLDLKLSFGYKEGVPDEEYQDIELTAKLKINSYQRTGEDEYLKIKNYEDFQLMQAGNNYRLIDNITLPYDYTPFRLNINKFDGNGYKIILPSTINVQTSSWGIFDNTNENFVVSNLTVVCNTTFHVQPTDSEIAVLVANNAGTVYNCKITGQKINIHLTESDDVKTVSFAPITFENDGYVISSKVESISQIVVPGSVAGLVATNSGIISNCYVSATAIESTREDDSSLAGFVLTNNANAKITSSYVFGRRQSTNLHSDSDVIKLVAKQLGVGFVNTNNGLVSDCYANIKVEASKVVSGFCYDNGESGEIVNCYSSCLLKSNDNTKYPFVAGQSSSYFSTGRIEGCVYVDVNNISMQHAPLNGLLNVNINNALNLSNYQSYAFSTAKITNAVWKKNINTLPTLVGADRKFDSHYEVGDEKTDENGVVKIVWEHKGAQLGSYQNPYIVDSAQKLENYLTENIANNKKHAYISLIKDIDYEPLLGATKLSKITFEGLFEGNSCSIENLVLSSTSSASNSGFFAQIGSTNATATIKNISIEADQVFFANSANVGTLAGSAINAGVFNVDVSCSSVIKGELAVGGVVGKAVGCEFVNIKTNVSVNATACSQSSDIEGGKNAAINLSNEKINNISRVSVAGSIVGALQDGSRIIVAQIIGGQNDAANVVIAQLAGGAVGMMKGSGQNPTTIKSVEALDYISIMSLFASGGMVGYLDCSSLQNDSANIEDCNFVTSTASYGDGEVAIVPVFVGGIVGFVKNGKILSSHSAYNDVLASESRYVGGIAGYIEKGTISNSDVLGDVCGGMYAGGIAGKIHATGDVAITNCVVQGDVMAVMFASQAGGVVSEIINDRNNSKVVVSNNRVASSIISSYLHSAGVCARVQAEHTVEITKNSVGLLADGKSSSMTISTLSFKNSFAGKVISESVNNIESHEPENYNIFGEKISLSGCETICYDLVTFKITASINSLDEDILQTLTQKNLELKIGEESYSTNVATIVYRKEGYTIKFNIVGHTDWKIDKVFKNGEQITYTSDGVFTNGTGGDETYVIYLTKSDQKSS